MKDQSYDCRAQVLEKVCSSRRKLRCWWGAGQIRLLDLACGGHPDDDEDEDGDDEDEEEEEEEEGEREETPVDRIPHSHEVSLAHGDKAITSLALDPSGSRVISGGADYELKFWDFAGEQILYTLVTLKTVNSLFVLHLLSNLTTEWVLNRLYYLIF